jgi:hypothetical protein
MLPLAAIAPKRHTTHSAVVEPSCQLHFLSVNQVCKRTREKMNPSGFLEEVVFYSDTVFKKTTLTVTFYYKIFIKYNQYILL